MYLLISYYSKASLSLFPGGLFSKTEMSEVLTEILKVDPSFDKDTFLKLCERDIIPNILEVCGSSLAPVCISCKCLLFLPQDSEEMFFFFCMQKCWITSGFAVAPGPLLRASVCVSLRRQWSKGSWRCWRTGAMKRYIHPHTHWRSASSDETFHTYSQPEDAGFILPSAAPHHIFADSDVLHLFIFLDIQPAGTPHSASQGYGPSVPLQDPGYWQYWCKFLHTTLHSQSNETLSSGASQ